MIHFNITRSINERANIILKRLIPSNCLCGPSDSVIGFRDGYLPFSVEELTNDAILETLLDTSGKLVINSCLIQVPPTFKNRLLESIKAEYASLKCNIVLLGYRLHVACHNQWNFISSRGIKNSIECFMDHNSIKASGVLRIDDSIEKSALVFQLVVTFKISYENKIIEYLPIIVGE